MPFQQNSVHINRPLTEISIAYLQDSKNFVADKIFPKIPVQKQSDFYFVYERGEFNRDEVRPRAPGSEATKANFNIKISDPFQCRNYALREEIPYETIQQQDSPLDVEYDASLYLMQKFLISKELNFAKTFFNSGVWDREIKGSDTQGSGQTVYWDDYKNEGSNPLKDIRNAMTTMQLVSGGFRPNTLLLTRPVYDALVDHPVFLDRVLYNPTGGEATIESPELARLFGLKNIYIMESIVNTGLEGLPENNQFVCGNNALLAYIADRPGLRSPSAGYTFTWSGVFAQNGGRGAPVGTGEVVVSSYWWQPRKVQIIEAETSYDMKVIGKDLGILFTNIIKNPPKFLEK